MHKTESWYLVTKSCGGFRTDTPFVLQHGSDSGVIDNEGRFVPQTFQNVFAKYDKEGDGTLTLREMFDMMSGQRVAADPFGVRQSSYLRPYPIGRCIVVFGKADPMISPPVGSGFLGMGRYLAFTPEGWQNI